MAPDVSIIIVNYNSGDCLKQCIESIYTHTQNFEFEIIVVDNASTDSSFVNICVQFANICGLKNSSNLGFSAANNIGAKRARGTYLLFLNPDTLLVDDSISSFHQFLETSDSRIAACGARLETPDGAYSVSYGNFPTLFQQFSDIGFRVFYKGQYDRKLSISPPCDFNTPRPVGYLSGANIFIRKKVFDELGGFDERFFMYYEDTDLFYRLANAGYQAYLLPHVKIIHHESRTELPDGSFNYSKYAMLERSKYLYFRKNHGRLSGFLAKVFQLFALVFHYSTKFRYSLRKVMKITVNG